MKLKTDLAHEKQEILTGLELIQGNRLNQLVAESIKEAIIFDYSLKPVQRPIKA